MCEHNMPSPSQVFGFKPTSLGMHQLKCGYRKSSTKVLMKFGINLALGKGLLATQSREKAKASLLNFSTFASITYAEEAEVRLVYHIAGRRTSIH
jgi:hypothetical protein